MKHTSIATNGVKLHVVQAGDPQGPLVIFLHGFPDFWYGWRRQIGALAAAGFRVWAPDQRGYNLSDKPGGVADYGLDLLAQDIVGLMDAAGVERASVVGHDWGGAVAWWLGLHHSDRVAKLAILNSPHPAAFTRYLRNNRRQQVKSAYMAFFQLPRLPEFASRHFGKWALRRSSLPGTFSDEDLAQYQTAWNQPGALTAMINWYRASRQRLNVSPMHNLTVATPTQIIWGADDAFFEPGLAELSLELCTNGKLKMAPDATHWVQHEAPDEVSQLLVAHFRGG